MAIEVEEHAAEVERLFYAMVHEKIAEGPRGFAVAKRLIHFGRSFGVLVEPFRTMPQVVAVRSSWRQVSLELLRARNKPAGEWAATKVAQMQAIDGELFALADEAVLRGDGQDLSLASGVVRLSRGLARELRSEEDRAKWRLLAEKIDRARARRWQRAASRTSMSAPERAAFINAIRRMIGKGPIPGIVSHRKESRECKSQQAA